MRIEIVSDGSDGSITIASANRARRIKRAFDAVITIEDPMTPRSRQVRFHAQPTPPHLILRFEDLDEPYEPMTTVSIDQVRSILDFGRQHRVRRLLVHCHAGIARSTAAALSILADRLGAGREAEALDAMLSLQPDAVPNLMVVNHADTLLARNGALVRVVAEWDVGREWNQRRRRLNREAVLREYHYAGPQSLTGTMS